MTVGSTARQLFSECSYFETDVKVSHSQVAIGGLRPPVSCAHYMKGGSHLSSFALPEVVENRLLPGCRGCACWYLFQIYQQKVGLTVVADLDYHNNITI